MMGDPGWLPRSDSGARVSEHSHSPNLPSSTSRFRFTSTTSTNNVHHMVRAVCRVIEWNRHVLIPSRGLQRGHDASSLCFRNIELACPFLLCTYLFVNFCIALLSVAHFQRHS